MKWYYLLAALPSLPPNFDTEPPLTITAFWNKIEQQDEQLRQVVQAILLIHDIENLEQVDVGGDPAGTATIPEEILRRFAKDPTAVKPYLPDELATLIIQEDWRQKIWHAYFDYAYQIAGRYSLISLREWLDWELGLKSACYRTRTNKPTSDLPVGKYMTHTGALPEYELIMESYRKAANPLEAEQLLDQARWQKIVTLCTPYSFATDEVVAYTLHLLLRQRWWNISQNTEDIFEKVAND